MSSRAQQFHIRPDLLSRLSRPTGLFARSSERVRKEFAYRTPRRDIRHILSSQWQIRYRVQLFQIRTCNRGFDKFIAAALINSIPRDTVRLQLQKAGDMRS